MESGADIASCGKVTDYMWNRGDALHFHICVEDAYLPLQIWAPTAPAHSCILQLEVTITNFF